MKLQPTRVLTLLLAGISVSASAARFSELPPTQTGSIDEIFNSCFADAGCNAQIQPLVATLSNRWGSDLDELLHHCLSNVRSMTVCSAFRSEVLASELADLESSIAQSHGADCAKHLVARAKSAASVKVEACRRQAGSLGESADGRMHRISCGGDQDLLVLASVRQLNLAKMCGRGG